jgi:hypothetical protein
VVLLVASSLLAGCGSASPQESSVSAVSLTGLRYTYRVTVDGDRECAIETYSGLREKGQPPTETSRFCGSAGASLNGVESLTIASAVPRP